ncbi:MAG: hypothetical protein JKY26_15800 [Pseudomonas sp.]|nr:hypothetical protein [Pseudomonas sp.]
MNEHLPDQDLTPEDAEPVVTTAKAGVPAFKFPFSPANFAPRQASSQPWHGKGSTSRHEKKIGMAPKGTRRSMGKR